MQTNVGNSDELEVLPRIYANQGQNLEVKVKAEEYSYVEKNGFQKEFIVAKDTSSKSKSLSGCAISCLSLKKSSQAPKSIIIHDFKKLGSSETLSFLWQDAKWFNRRVKASSEIVAIEVKTTREINAQRERWVHLQEAFHERFLYLQGKARNN